VIACPHATAAGCDVHAVPLYRSPFGISPTGGRSVATMPSSKAPTRTTASGVTRCGFWLFPNARGMGTHCTCAHDQRLSAISMPHYLQNTRSSSSELEYACVWSFRASRWYQHCLSTCWSAIDAPPSPLRSATALCAMSRQRSASTGERVSAAAVQLHEAIIDWYYQRLLQCMQFGDAPHGRNAPPPIATVCVSRHNPTCSTWSTLLHMPRYLLSS
jgi:hypothetical protein